MCVFGISKILEDTPAFANDGNPRFRLLEFGADTGHVRSRRILSEHPVLLEPKLTNGIVPLHGAVSELVTVDESTEFSKEKS